MYLGLESWFVIEKYYNDEMDTQVHDLYIEASISVPGCLFNSILLNFCFVASQGSEGSEIHAILLTHDGNARVFRSQLCEKKRKERNK